MISPETVKKWAALRGKPVSETSAKHGWGVRALFADLAQTMVPHALPSATVRVRTTTSTCEDKQHWCCYIA